MEIKDSHYLYGNKQKLPTDLLRRKLPTNIPTLILSLIPPPRNQATTLQLLPVTTPPPLPPLLPPSCSAHCLPHPHADHPSIRRHYVFPARSLREKPVSCNHVIKRLGMPTSYPARVRLAASSFF